MSMERRYLKATAAILVAFAVGLVGFWLVSSELGDGLEVTMDEAGWEEPEQVWQAPLDYGDDYVGGLIAGIIGFAATFGVVYLYMRGTKKLEQPR
jgi:hypothetical protein